MLIFRSEEHVERWCSTHELPRGAVFTPEQAWLLALEWFKDKARPDWRRHTPDETQELFERLGFTGDFWRLS